jgi:hypothetical protein
MIASSVFMFTNEQILKLKSLYECFKSENYFEAEKIFLQLKISGTGSADSLPKEFKNLFFDLHEFLIIGDGEHATDKETILNRFKIIFPESIE